MIEDVEDLPPCLNAIALFEREVFEDGEVPVLEALVAENVPAHVAETPERGRSDDRFAIRRHVAAGGV